MLVLSRRAGERLVLTMGAHKATVALISMAGNRARVGIDAPRYIKVIREEVLDEIEMVSSFAKSPEKTH